MSLVFKRSVLTLLILLLAAPPGQARLMSLKPVSNEPEPKPEPETVPVVLHSRALPVPSLQFQLLPTLGEQKRGNAALDYHNLVTVLPKNDNWNSLCERIDEYRDWDLETFRARQQEVQEVLVYQETLLQHATERDHCDWQETLEDGFDMLLPNLAEYRTVAKMISLQARLHAVNGRYHDAIDTLRHGFVLARNLGRGKTLIQHLVGIAIAQLMFSRIEEMIQQPDCPNLYWALTALPDPLVDIRQAALNELSLYNYFCPALREIDTRVMSTQEATAALRQILTLAPNAQPGLLVSGLVFAGYPRAKKLLIEQGFDADWVEQIPAAQAVLLYQWREYVPIRDETAQWFLLDEYPRAAAELAKVEAKIRTKKNQRAELLTNLFFNLMPALSHCRLTMARQQRTTAALRTLEALRSYAATEGRLPDRLDDITAVPVPANPVTGRPFDYRRTDGGARIELFDPQPKRMKIYAITLATP